MQKALLESRGIERLHAVMGPSMGALQAYEWASAYPKRVERLIPVIGSGMADPWLLAVLNTRAAPYPPGFPLEPGRLLRRRTAARRPA
ncbi:hypothetical protein [Halomonas sp. E19]|uniref:hypothetical protein n=1 Tax=Halomonas sp. E19 TaxID=3397247 RepID=UPI004034DE1A